jgi:uncharacterized protein (DUF433 family)
MERTPTQTAWKHLERDPLSSYFQLSIKGRRIKARTLYSLFVSQEEPHTVEEIAGIYDLPMEAVREAVEYCQSKPPELDLDFQIEQALMTAHGMNHPAYKFDPKGRYRVLSPLERGRVINDVIQRFKIS